MRKFSFTLFFAFVIFSACFIDIIHAAGTDSPSCEYKAGRILGFARYLISKDEFYRAHVELLRCRSFYPGYISPDNFYTTELYLLFRGKRYEEILNRKSGKEKGQFLYINTLFRADSFLESNEFLNAVNCIKPVFQKNNNGDLNFYLYKRMFLSYLLLNNIEKAQKIIDNNKKIEGIDYPGFEEAIGYSEDAMSSLREPYCAMALGVVPGLGYAYANEKETGIVAFLVVSVFSALTYYSFKTDNKPMGIVFGAAGAFFYSGNILGGYMAAGRYNSGIMDNLKDYLSNRLELAEDREKIYNNYGIGNVGQ